MFRAKLEKSTIVDTSYANGKLYQLPMVSIKDLAYGQYDVTIKAMRTKNRADETVTNSYVYIDAIRIYDPANTKDGKTQLIANITGSDIGRIKEVRDLLLGSVKFENLDAILKNMDSSGDDSTTGTTTTTSGSGCFSCGSGSGLGSGDVPCRKCTG